MTAHLPVRGELADVPSEREIEVLVALVRYSTEKAAGSHLGLARQTISNHERNLFRKLGVTNRTAAVVKLWPQLRDRFVLPNDTSVGPSVEQRVAREDGQLHPALTFAGSWR
jgi:DNA-binding CsgD family transcriptional regulator